MSYDIDSPDLERLSFSSESLINFMFLCPRCSTTTVIVVKPEELLHGFEVECESPICVGQGERFGYKIYFQPGWTDYYLGHSDRPLHDEEELAENALRLFRKMNPASQEKALQALDQIDNPFEDLKAQIVSIYKDVYKFLWGNK